MTHREIAGFRTQLTEMLQRVDHERKLLREEALQPNGGEASGGISNTPIHPSDISGHAFDEEVTLGLLENEEHLLEEINGALARIEHGSFGKCLDCQKPISAQRLQAVPYARYCVRCARKPQTQPS